MNQNPDYQPNQNGSNSFFDPVAPTEEQKPSRGFAVASLVLGIASLCTCCCCALCGFLFVPLVCAILAIVFAIVAKTRTPDGKFPGMALAGLILGIIGAFICIVLMFFVYFILPAVSDQLLLEYEEMIRAEFGDEFYEEFMKAYQGALGKVPS